MDALSIRGLGRDFERFWEEFSGLYRESGWTPAFDWYISPESCGCFPNLDVIRGQDHFTMKVELPGLTEKDFDLEVNNQVLTISGKYPEPEQKDETLIHRERSSGEFRRSFKLPDDVDGEHIEAVYKNGLLEIKLPRTGKAAEKHIKVEVH